MANMLFPKGKEGLLDGSIDLDTAVIRCALLRGYSYSASHSVMSEVIAASTALVSTSAALGTKTVTNGVFNAASPTTFPSVAAGAACTRIVIYQSSTVTGAGDPVATSAQRVIALIDTASGGAALSVVPTGANIDITWDTGANKIFSL